MLKKAYDSVPCAALLKALRKLGILNQTISLIHAVLSLDMQAQIHLDGILLEEINADNSLRQECCMTPVLLKLMIGRSDTLLSYQSEETLPGVAGPPGLRPRTSARITHIPKHGVVS